MPSATSLSLLESELLKSIPLELAEASALERVAEAPATTILTLEAWVEATASDLMVEAISKWEEALALLLDLFKEEQDLLRTKLIVKF